MIKILVSLLMMAACFGSVSAKSEPSIQPTDASSIPNDVLLAKNAKDKSKV